MVMCGRGLVEIVDIVPRPPRALSTRLTCVAHQNPFHRVHSGNAIVIPNRTVVWGANGALSR